MLFSLDSNTSTYQIRGYAPGKIKINSEDITTSLVVMTHHLISPWEPQSIETLTLSHLQLIIDHYHPEIILLGTGTQLIFPAPELMNAMTKQNIGLEVMNTGAACRTYNVLSAEGRNVAAALINS